MFNNLNIIIMKSLNINIYQFDELNDKAKEFAINEHRSFLLSLPTELENEEGELVEYYENSYSDEEVIENIVVNEYWFFADGKLTSATTYTGKHPKAGSTEIKFHGETILLD